MTSARRIICLSLTVGLLLWVPPAGAQEPPFDPTLAEELLAEAGWIHDTEVHVLQPSEMRSLTTGVPVDPSEVSNELLYGGVTLFDLGGQVPTPDDFATPNVDLLNDIVQGDAAWFSRQPGLQLVWFVTSTSLEGTGALVAEVSVGYALPGQELLEENPMFPFDTLIGRSSSLSIARFEGRDLRTHAVVSEGRFNPTADLLPAFAGYTDDGVLWATILPATATNVQLQVSQSLDGTATGLAASTALLDPPVDVVRLGDEGVPSGANLEALATAFITEASFGGETAPVGEAPVEAPPVADDDAAGEGGAGAEVAGDDAGSAPGWQWGLVPLVVLGIPIGWRWTRRRASNAPASPGAKVYGPAPPETDEERFAKGFASQGEITPEMAEWSLAADLALSRRFGGNVQGQWVFPHGERSVIPTGDPLPEGATVVGPDPDGDGTVVTSVSPRREYRIGADGSFLGLYAYDRTPAATVLIVTHEQNESTHWFPVTNAHARDESSARIFTSITSAASEDDLAPIRADHGGGLHLDGDLSQPDPRWVDVEPNDLEESMARMADRLHRDGIVAPWANDESHPLNPLNKHRRSILLPQGRAPKR
ncbi:MAG: hypothetical protein ACSLFP_07840 [Acidimicrobiales bacterium]